MEYEEVLPGTRRLYQPDGSALQGDADLQRHGDIVLVPQPTDSPNDPLRWSIPRKLWGSFLVCFVTGLTAATSNDAGSAQYNQNLDLGIPYGVFNTGAGILFIGIGYWTLLLSPAAYLYGRRLPYLVCMLIGVAGAVWFAKVEYVRDTLWSQLLVGASESVAEANAQSSLMDLWFNHQRGAVLGVYILSTSIGTYLGPLVASYIADSDLGWRWIGWFGAIFSGTAFVLVLFGLEETGFERDRLLTGDGQRYLIDAVNSDGRSSGEGPTSSGDERGKPGKEAAAAATASGRDAEKHPHDADAHPHPGLTRRRRDQETPKPYWRRIAIITPASNLRGLGFRQYAQRLFHILRVFSFPAVLFAGLQWGAQDAWLTFYLTVEEDTWYDAPWFYSDAAVGNMSIPSLIGAVIGSIYGGWYSDTFVRWMARRNGGVAEAEMRLWLLLPTALLFPTGMFLFGIGSNDGWPWPAPYVGLGFIGFGWGTAGDLSMAYLEDCYPDMILESMVGVAVVNNTIGMLFSFVASRWLDGSGVGNTFIAIGVLSFVFLATTVPMMIWGKACRRWTRDRYRGFLEIRDGMGK